MFSSCSGIANPARRAILAIIIWLCIPAITNSQTAARLTSGPEDKSKNSAKTSPPASSNDLSSPSSSELKPDAVTHNTSDPETADRLRALEEAVKSQNSRIEELKRTVQEQQLTIQALTSKSAPGSDAAASNTSGTAAAAEAQAVTSGKAQVPPVEARLKTVEDQLLKIGPFRFSGDFRLRFDAITRKADPTPPAGFAPLPHHQNVRMRYRFRFNMETDINPSVSFHGQLATGPINNPLTNDQDFTSTVARHPFFINEAWIDYHPNKALQLQAGRVQEIFADNSRFLFDDDVRFNGFNERYAFSFAKPVAGFTSIELRAGQYIFSNPNVAIVTPGSPLALAGAVVGSTGRSSNLFHQGILFNQKLSEKFTQQFGGDVQLYRNPNQIQLASTADGVALIVQPGLGLALSGPIGGTGNATTTPGGAIYSAPNFQIGRLTYRLTHTGFKFGDHEYPITFNAQVARNMGTGMRERDALLAAAQLGRITKRGDMAFLYVFAIKGANSMISQLTDDDLGTNSGVNIRTNYLRFEYGLAKKITFQSLVFIQRELRNSGQFPQFFVPLNAFTPRQYRFQEQILFTF